MIYPRLVFARCSVASDLRIQRGAAGEIQRIAVTLDWGEGRVVSIADGPLRERMFLAAMAPTNIAAVLSLGPNRAHLVGLFSRDEYAALRAGRVDGVAPCAKWLWDEAHRLAGALTIDVRLNDEGSDVG